MSLDQDLFAHYKCESISNNTLVDSSGNDNHATVYGGSLVNGEVGLAFHTTHEKNQGARVSLFSNVVTSFSFFGSFSAAPVTTGQSDNRYNCFMMADDNVGNSRVRLFDYNQQGLFFNMADASSNITIEAPDLLDGQTHSYCAQYDAATGLMSLYVDGELIDEQNKGAGFVPPSSDLLISRTPAFYVFTGGNDRGLNGWQDELRIYQRVLDPLEIADLHSQSFPQPDPIDIGTAVFHADQYALSETISFQTAINRAESGAEYRTALYPYPDRVWQFNASNDQLSMFNFQQGRLSDWYVPAMQLAEKIDVAQGATNVPFDHFGYVYLTNGVNNQLTTISGNTLTDAATHDFTHVAPAYVGKLIENPVMRHNALYARNSVQFRMQIYDDLAFTPEHTYQGDEVFTECTLLQGMSTTEYSQDIGVNATINNYFDIHADTQSTQFKRPVKLLYYREQLKRRYSWLFDKQGRYKPFWYPSFGNEFEGFSVSGQVITVPKTHVPKHVAIEKDGAWTFYAVSVAEVNDTLELTLDALPPAEPFNLYRLDHVRLDSDSVTIEHGYTFALDLTITELP